MRGLALAATVAKTADVATIYRILRLRMTLPLQRATLPHGFTIPPFWASSKQRANGGEEGHGAHGVCAASACFYWHSLQADALHQHANRGGVAACAALAEDRAYGRRNLRFAQFPGIVGQPADDQIAEALGPERMRDE
jgi:hypothetical protein